MTTRLYELTMTGVHDPDTYREHIFEAPDDTAALMHAMRWPSVNGWNMEVKVTVGRAYPVKVDRHGHVESMMSVFQFVTDLSVFPDPGRWVSDEDIRAAADYIMLANRPKED